MLTIKRASNRRRIQAWRRQVSRAQKTMGKTLSRHFQQQAERLAREVAGGNHLVDMLFRPDAEHEKLMAALQPQLSRLMHVGAEVSQQIADLPTGISFDVELSPRAQQHIHTFLGELGEQPYWRNIQAMTKNKLTELLEYQPGRDWRQVAKEIEQALGGESARRRARTIARTEAGAAMEAGQYSTLLDQHERGIVVAKTWLGGTRETHAVLDGVTIPVPDNFSVGAGSAPFPHHWSLPPEERVNCTCTTIGKLGEP